MHNIHMSELLLREEEGLHRLGFELPNPLAWRARGIRLDTGINYTELTRHVLGVEKFMRTASAEKGRVDIIVRQPLEEYVQTPPPNPADALDTSTHFWSVLIGDEDTELVKQIIAEEPSPYEVVVNAFRRYTTVYAIREQTTIEHTDARGQVHNVDFFASLPSAG